jgi:hypothetical protein
MTTPATAMFELLDAAEHNPLSVLLRDHGSSLVLEAGRQGLIRIDGVSVDWAVNHASGIQRQTFLVHLTDNGANYADGA